MIRKIRNFLAFVTCAIMSATFISCGNDGGLSAKFNDKKITSIMIGEMIDFDEFIDYTDGASVKVFYTTPTMPEAAEEESMYFTAEELGEHNFTLEFSLGDKTKTLKCTINVVPPAPEVVEPETSVYCATGETVTFNALITRSGIRIVPARYSTTKFLRVEYANEAISVENYSKQTETVEFAETDESYTFRKAGTYTFYINVSNASGSVDAKIGASVLDSEGEYPISGVKSDGVIYGENNAVKVMQGGSTESSYIASEQEFETKTGEYLMTELEFCGKNAPRLLFFADEINGNVSLGKGVGITLENSVSATAMRIFGPDRFSATKPLVERNNSFGADSLKSGKYYKWRVIITRISSAKLAVKSQLFELDGETYKEVARFDWASFAYGYESKGYVEYMSAGYGDVIFRYSAPSECDKDGNKL